MPKKRFFEIFSKKNFFFLSDFLEFLFFFLNLELNPHIHLFFQLSSCTGWFTIKDFPIFQKTAFFAFFWTLPLQLGCFFYKSNPDPLLLTVDRSWESCWMFVMTFQLPPKNWQSSVTSLKKCAFFLADTVLPFISGRISTDKGPKVICDLTFLVYCTISS